jgi:hypothetical protein
VISADTSNLPSTVWAHCDVSVGAASEAWIYTCAKGGLAFFAIAASSISNVKGHHNPVAFLEEGYTCSELFDYAHVLMACGETQRQFDGGWCSLGTYQK